jgi:hypothetical protein
MIAFAGCKRLLAGMQEGPQFDVYPRWNMESLEIVR